MSRWLWLLLLLFSLVACGEDASGPEPTPVRNASATTTRTPRPVPSATVLPLSMPSSTPLPTATLTPEAPSPVIVVSEQVLTDDGQLVVQSATTLAPGWLVVYTDDEGRPGEILGYAPVTTGENEGIIIEIDPYQATTSLHILLHRDDGLAGAFEFPGPDSTVRAAGDIVSAGMEVVIEVFAPALSVSDQEVTPSGEVVLGQVAAPEVGWVVLHADGAGEPGAVLGQSPVNEGDNEQVLIHFNWREATPRMYVMLYHDRGEIGLFEPTLFDEPVEVGGELVMSPFNVTLPPDVFVLNQPVIDDAIVVERVVINEPGWLVAYTDLDGEVNLRIGEVQLEPGINTGIVLPIDGESATDLLHLRLHADDDPVGEFDHPRSDDPLRYDGRLQSFTFRTNAGNYVITRDQSPGPEGTVLVPLVVTEVPTWVVIQTDENGAPGEVVGSAWAPAGVNRGVIVGIDLEVASETLHVTLHQDAGVEQELEYPDGVDVPLQRNRVPIRAPFQLLTPTD